MRRCGDRADPAAPGPRRRRPALLRAAERGRDRRGARHLGRHRQSPRPAGLSRPCASGPQPSSARAIDRPSGRRSDDRGDLVRELERRADHVHGVPLSFDDVRGKARSISGAARQRGGRGGCGGGARRGVPAVLGGHGERGIEPARRRPGATAVPARRRGHPGRREQGRLGSTTPTSPTSPCSPTVGSSSACSSPIPSASTGPTGRCRSSTRAAEHGHGQRRRQHRRLGGRGLHDPGAGERRHRARRATRRTDARRGRGSHRRGAGRRPPVGRGRHHDLRRRHPRWSRQRRWCRPTSRPTPG